MDYSDLLDKANKCIEKIQIGKVFCVKDLFKGTEWKSLKKGEKLGFGKYFKNKVMNDYISNVEYIGKADNNSAQYRKK